MARPHRAPGLRKPQSVWATSRDESQSVPSPEKPLKTRDLELPFFEGSLPSCSPHSVGYTRTSLHPYFSVANQNRLGIGLFWGAGGVSLFLFPFQPIPYFSQRFLKNILMGLFFMGCFPGSFQEGKRPIKAFRETAH